jgi:hypothetical protein
VYAKGGRAAVCFCRILFCWLFVPGLSEGGKARQKSGMNVTQSIRPLLKIDRARNKKVVVWVNAPEQVLKREGIPDHRAG